VTRNDLEKLRKKGVEDLDEVLKRLWETKMIAIFQDDKNNEYFCLICDFFIERYFPRFILDSVRNQYRDKIQNTGVLVKALDLMKEEYYALVKAKKIQEASVEDSAA